MYWPMGAAVPLPHPVSWVLLLSLPSSHSSGSNICDAVCTVPREDMLPFCLLPSLALLHSSSSTCRVARLVGALHLLQEPPAFVSTVQKYSCQSRHDVRDCACDGRESTTLLHNWAYKISSHVQSQRGAQADTTHDSMLSTPDNLSI